MLGFSLQKLILLIGIVVAIWYGFKVIGRLQQARKTDAALRRKTAMRSGAGSVEAEDMVPCQVCGSFVPARSPASCGRSDCPY